MDVADGPNIIMPPEQDDEPEEPDAPVFPTQNITEYVDRGINYDGMAVIVIISAVGGIVCCIIGGFGIK